MEVSAGLAACGARGLLVSEGGGRRLLEIDLVWLGLGWVDVNGVWWSVIGL